MQPEAVARSDSEQAVAAPSGELPARWAELPEDTPITIIRGSRNAFDLGLANLWTYRELLFFLIWRDIKVRYKQTAVGLLWVVMQPVMTMIIFTFVFGHLAKLPTNGVPYPLFVFSGLLPWQLFSSGITSATTSVVSNSGLITKVYFPRLIIPISSVVSSLVDFSVSLCVLIGLMAYYRDSPGLRVVAIPVFIVIAIVTALTAGLWLSMLNVRFRDVQYTIPFLLQAWMFLTPVAYASSLIPVRWKPLIGINPMTAVVEGFRWSFVGGQPPWQATSSIISLCVTGVALFLGILFFRRMEKTFADLI